ncbi:hypothetical protein pipiens_015261 [Culex pipiens pipiens]|uniref:Kinesin-like protein n=1 Tax=Culex pipiens pipiens TaxID=38569 RepID=A0ABD1CRE2_CULPP
MSRFYTPKSTPNRFETPIGSPARPTPTPRSHVPKATTSTSGLGGTRYQMNASSSESLSSASSSNFMTPKNPAALFAATKSKSSTALNSARTPSSLFRGTPTGGVPGGSCYGTPRWNGVSKMRAPAVVTERTPECYSKVSLESPLVGRKSRKLDESIRKDAYGGEISNLKVAVRIRPLSAKECVESVANVVKVKENEVIVNAGNTADNTAGVEHCFQYDHAFWSCNAEHPSYVDQPTVYRGLMKPLLDKAFEGYNACLFAYGQTGSGKSYSMMGMDSDDLTINQEAGIIPRFCQELFHRIDSIKDKIQAEVEETSLKVREHPVWGPYVVDLSTHPVDSHSALRNWLAVGNSQRATAATGMNDKSSRSHSIFSVVLNLSEAVSSEDSEGKPIHQTKRAKISLVDLAGSERISHTCASGDRLKEGVSINKSLLTLGKVISSLAESKRNTAAYIPYRDSVLTWLLRVSKTSKTLS